jgi:hypothetical protein
VGRQTRKFCGDARQAFAETLTIIERMEMKTRMVPANELDPAKGLRAQDYIEPDPPPMPLKWAWSHDEGRFSGTYDTEAEALAAGQEDFEDGFLDDHDNWAVVSILVGKLAPVDPLEAMEFEDIVDRMSEFAHNATGREEEWPPAEFVPKLATHIAKFFEEHKEELALLTIEGVVERKFRISWDEDTDEDYDVNWEEGVTRYRFTYKAGGEEKKSRLYKTAFECRKKWKSLNLKTHEKFQRFEPVELFFPLDEEGKPVIPDDA